MIGDLGLKSWIGMGIRVCHSRNKLVIEIIRISVWIMDWNLGWRSGIRIWDWYLG